MDGLAASLAERREKVRAEKEALETETFEIVKDWIECLTQRGEAPKTTLAQSYTFDYAEDGIFYFGTYNWNAAYGEEEDEADYLTIPADFINGEREKYTKNSEVPKLTKELEIAQRDLGHRQNAIDRAKLELASATDRFNREFKAVKALKRKLAAAIAKEAADDAVNHDDSQDE